MRMLNKLTYTIQTITYSFFELRLRIAPGYQNYHICCCYERIQSFPCAMIDDLVKYCKWIVSGL